MIATLDTLAAHVAAAGLVPPTLIVVGEVVALAEELAPVVRGAAALATG